MLSLFYLSGSLCIVGILWDMFLKFVIYSPHTLARFIRRRRMSVLLILESMLASVAPA